MSRTRRHVGADYLCLFDRKDPDLSEDDRQWVVRFYSDGCFSFNPPRKYILKFKRAMNTHNDRMLRRWMNDPDFDPVFEVKHYYRATFTWY